EPYERINSRSCSSLFPDTNGRWHWGEELSSAADYPSRVSSRMVTSADADFGAKTIPPRYLGAYNALRSCRHWNAATVFGKIPGSPFTTRYSRTRVVDAEPAGGTPSMK